MTARTAVRGLALALALAGTRAFGAEADAADVRVVFDGIEPHVDGLLVQVYDDSRLSPQLVLDNRTSRPLEVLDRRGRSMLRIRPQASYGWFDGRIDPERVRPPEPDAEIPAVLGQWRVPARHDGRLIELRGHFVYEPRVPGVYVARLLSAREPAPGVRVALSDGARPTLRIENAGRQPVVVLGEQGEPFLLVTAAGVEANLASPTWQRLGRSRSAVAPRGAVVRWHRVSRVPRYTWQDARAGQPPAQGSAHRWEIPVRVGGRALAIRGVTEWQPAVY